jgi:hypothetical protein
MWAETLLSERQPLYVGRRGEQRTVSARKLTDVLGEMADSKESGERGAIAIHLMLSCVQSIPCQAPYFRFGF